MSGEVYSIGGGWLGAFHYGGSASQWERPVRFEATFTAPGAEGRFLGTILDDGPLGAANVHEGVQIGRGIRFTKVYIRPPSEYETAPIYYEGTISEDGRRITGTWEMRMPVPGRPRRSLRTRGTWEARRQWSEEEETEPAEASGTRERELAAVGSAG